MAPSAVVAETRSAGQSGVLDATQRLPREAMLYAYTRNAAHALNQLDEIGSLAPEKRADLILIDRDVFTVPIPELNGAKVLWTMFGGKLYQDKRLENGDAERVATASRCQEVIR